jgi:hypothetical protein
MIVGGQLMASMDELKAAYEQGARSGDFQQMGDALQKSATEDFVDEWPQSGERLNLAALKKMGESYEGATGTRPSYTHRRMLTGGDVFVIEGTIDYGDGVPVRYVGVGEVREGKVARMTEYFANPFEAPAWRTPFVERYEP